MLHQCFLMVVIKGLGYEQDYRLSRYRCRFAVEQSCFFSAWLGEYPKADVDLRGPDPARIGHDSFLSVADHHHYAAEVSLESIVTRGRQDDSRREVCLWNCRLGASDGLLLAP
jgi:hypothetical protein